jgi:hypothetical protein
MLRVAALVAGLTTALPAVAGEMSASEARQFVVEKLFSYACFDGTRGMARVHADGSVDGSIQARGAGLVRYGTMPLGTCGSRANESAHRCLAGQSSRAFIWSGPLPKASAVRSQD